MASAAAEIRTGRKRADVSRATRIKIMEAAERLFADRGIDGVALREIAVEAGQGNNTAVQYHFGSKEQLVYAIFDHRTAMFEPMRARMLDEAEAADRLSDAKVLLQILCFPHLSIADAGGGHPYSAFLAHYLTRARIAGISHPYDDPEVPVPALRRVRRLLAERVPHVPADMLRLRIASAKLMFLNMLMRRDGGFPRPDQNIPLEILVEDTLDQAAAALTAPYTAGRGPLFDLPEVETSED
ncbi:AcrR family transcriptional regulator [Sphingomonas jejuensis]|uniref:AcrR family transcriptional regulator n=1 Tax=Sphingomonas jejuensis TaxID=904715 RepID=A0ABX0XKU2_9SPHN|nr:TetR/AcrR family transcriptional regulator [Sphingomonas jejuensis]NJC33973.1 AcrR family transcriptional regulator [Sphingomonas jejuensis]